MNLRKAAEMALEALEWNYGTDLENIENCMSWLDKMNATIPALRQALAQPEQEPVGYVTIENISSWAQVPSIKWFKKPTEGPLYTAPVDAVNMSQERVYETAKREHEPVAWVYNGILHEFDPSEFATSEVKPLYTAPPKREWVGLEDNDFNVKQVGEFYVEKFARYIEAILKERNCGPS